MGEIISIVPTPAAVDAAWERYRALLAVAIETPAILLDRARHQELITAEATFKHAFLASDRVSKGV